MSDVHAADRRHDFETRQAIDEILLSTAERVDKIAAIMMIVEDLPMARRIVAEHITSENEEF